MSPSKPKKTKRPRGDGAVFQRCDKSRGCPDRVPVAQPDGSTKLQRPAHRCKGMWIARIELEDGSRPQRAARSENLAKQRLNEMKEELAKSGTVAKSITLDAWFWKWIETVAGVRPNTKTNYKSIYRTHIGPKIGKREVRRLAIHPEPIRTAITTGRIATLTSTRKQAHAMLSGLFDAARIEGFATRNPMEAIKKPDPKQGKREGPTTDEMRAMLSYNARSGDRLASRWVAVPFTLQRSGECLGLQWDRIDWDDKIIDVSWQMQDLPYKHGCAENEPWPCGRKRAAECLAGGFDVPLDYEHNQLYGALHLVRPKSAAGERVIPMLPTLELALKQRHELYLAERENYAMETITLPDGSTRKRRVDHGLVWCRPNGRPLTSRMDTTGWKALEKAVGVHPYDLHGGRSTGATLLLEAGVPSVIVKALMGHTREEQSQAYQRAEIETIRRYMVEAIEGPLSTQPRPKPLPAAESA